jgi:hypothetical protein
MTSKIQMLHMRAIAIASQLKRSEADLIEILQELDAHKAFRDYGCASLYEYCVQFLNLSESTSYNLINVARKAKVVPELKIAIASGELSVSKARKIIPVLTPNNHTDWITLAKTKSLRLVEKAVAQAQPQLAITESVKYRSEDRLEFKLGISEALLEKLERVVDLESQRTSRPCSREDAIMAALDVYIEKLDPLKKAERLCKKLESKNETERASNKLKATIDAKTELQKPEEAKPVTGQVASHARRYIPAPVQHAVRMRDQNQCTYKDSLGRRCKGRRWLHVHHIQHKAHGGADTLANLTTLCSSHHRFTHSQSP